MGRHGLADLLRDPRVLEDLDPSPALLRALTSFMGRGDPGLQAELRRIAQRVIGEVMQRLRATLVQATSGRRDRHKRSPLRPAANFDAPGTIRANLANWDEERRAVIPARLRFASRARRYLDWTVILCVDQSGSMTDSLIHAALMAAVLAGLPGVEARMVPFDTSVVDVTGQLDDPLSRLLSIHLGGGTDIGRAVTSCEASWSARAGPCWRPCRTSRRAQGPRRLHAAVTWLHAARVRLIGLAALDDEGRAASKVVVVRAAKDVAAGQARPEEGPGGSDVTTARVAVNGETVTLSGKGLRDARCTCKAAGVRRHVVAAVIALRDGAAADPLPRAALSAIADLPFAAIEAFAGADWPRALAQAAEHAEVDRDATRAVRFPATGDAVSFPAGLALDAALHKGPRAARRPGRRGERARRR